MRKRIKVIVVVIIVIYSSISLISLIVLPYFMPFRNPMDVDYISEGKYAGCYLISDVSGPARIIDSFGRIKWQTNLNGDFIHDCDMLPNGNILIADITYDRVIEVDIDNSSSILWSWDARNPLDINWTSFAYERGWDEFSDTPTFSIFGMYWTHLNDVDFINGSQFGKNYNSILISLRNFDLVLEINYSETKDVIWWYGEPGNYSLLKHQHNPDRYENGNTVICDSENERIIEINTTSKEVVWELENISPYGEFRWVRDCDDIGDNKRLITDSGNNRLLIYDMNSMSIVREIKSPFFSNPYEADLLEDGRLIVSGITTGTILIMDFNTGNMTGMIGFPTYWVLPISIIIGVIIYHSAQLINAMKRSNKRNIRKLIDFQVYNRIIYIVCGILSLSFFTTIIAFLLTLFFG
ncbi:MAG: aryl-sulfate sulfotransferase [Candidatus Hermodarchaeota archaeon]